jgi:hypothetical protein
MSLTVTSDALADLSRYIDTLPGVSRRAARLAINDVATGKGMTLLRKLINNQVNFPSGYVNNTRLSVKRKATDQLLEAVIAARMRPTSLARFAPGQTPENTRRSGVRVQVKGGGKLIKQAFLMRLKAGKALSDENFNMGLAVRLKPGEQIPNKTKQLHIESNLYLLYGPSVDQVFSGVADEAAPELADEVETEFLRQFARLSNE